MDLFFLSNRHNIFMFIFLLSWTASCYAGKIPCYVLGHVALLVVLPAIPMINSQPNSTLPPERLTTMRKHAFEDVEWSIHREPFRERNDCFGHYIRCVRRTTPLLALCAFNTLTYYYEDYYSICHIEIENCIYHAQKKTGVFGDSSWKNNKVYHNGESYDCIHLFRRANSPEELDLIYFGGNKNEILAKWDKYNEEVNDYDSGDDYGGHLNFN